MNSPVGPISVRVDGDVVTEMVIGRSPDAPIPNWVADPLAAYFDGDLDALDALPLRLDGPAFQRKVWEALRRVPAGKTVSYSELAADAGNPKAVRAAGTACGKNPVWLAVPCHRALRSGGGLGGYGGGLDVKRWLLRHEGALLV